MHFPSYRRFVPVLAALGLFAIVGVSSASASSIPYIGGSQPGPYIGGSSYDYIPQPSPSYSSYPSSSYSSYPSSSSSCSGYSCYGQPSDLTGQPRTNYVSGYTRSDGTYVDPYFRS